MRMTKEEAIEYRVQYCEYPPYKDRIIFPVYENEEMVYFQARCVGEGHPKYLNPKKGHFKKSRRAIIFNLERAKDEVVITEGWLDAISIKNGVATFGKMVSEEQVLLLLSRKFKRYIILFDDDATKESLQLAERLLIGGADDVRIALLDGCDTNSNRKAAAEAVANAVKINLYDIWRLMLGE